MHVSRPSTGTMLGGLALFVALGGTAVAATTGQIVNISDPTAATHIAKVDSAGALKVKNFPNGATFSRSVDVGNYYANSFVPSTLLQSTATLNIDRIQLSVEDSGTSPWDGAIWYETGDASGCNGALIRISVEAAQPGTTHIDDFRDPLTLKPDAPGHVWCLKASFGPFDVTTDGSAYVDVSGVVTSGTFTPSNAVRPKVSGIGHSPTGG
jgi:hypothetical protein